MVLLGAAAAGWVVVAVDTLRETRSMRAMGGWVVSHRRGLTLLAAAGPVPYGLVRASWLTPWPLLIPKSDVLDPEMQLWGLLLGGGAVVGSVLTLGLIRPWGTVFPRWMPVLGGRPVPALAAIIPGGLVAGLLCASALPMLRATLVPAPDTVFAGLPLVARLGAVLIFPFWVWGPALALAVWAYAVARRAGPAQAR